MKSLLVSLLLLFATPAVKAETIMIPVQDLLIEIPNFTAPRVDINSVLNGGTLNIENPPKTQREKREMERKLRNLIMDLFPEVENVRFWNGQAIITITQI